jgi:hypothetical protein
MKATISFRAGTFLWRNKYQPRRDELLAWLKDYRDTVEELAFFTGWTHPPLPLKTIQEEAAELKDIIPEFKALGLRTGINHLSTIGHLNENLANSLNEPWQRLVDIDGGIGEGCYCTADPRMQEYVAQAYTALAQAQPDFLWVDDDVRLESHNPVRFACFCDRCMANFSAENGRTWTRLSLKTALNGGTRDERLTLRKQWLEHNRSYIVDLLTRVRAAVDTVNPKIPIGMMTGETSYSGYGFTRYAEALAGPRRVAVQWRPGGGFYSEQWSGGLLQKAHSIGRQNAVLPRAVKTIQSEHENFPYQFLNKSVAVFTAEIAAYIGAGCTGTALNCMGIMPDPFDEYRPYFEGVQARRKFYDTLVETFGRTPCTGLWTAFSVDHFAALNADGDWFASPSWGSSFDALNDVAEIGLPLAYAPEGARVAVLHGESCVQFPREELIRILSGGVLMDGAALALLNELGLAEYTGFAVAGVRDRDTLEQFTSDPINGRFGGWGRDCRPSFWPTPAYLLKPLTPQSRPLADLIDFTPTNHGPVAGAFENALGGRVAIQGYYPWTYLKSLAKTSQMKQLCRWLSKDTLPAYVSSYHKAAVWCRRDPKKRPAFLLLNAATDATQRLTLHVKGDVKALRLTRANMAVKTVARRRQEGPYAVFALPRLAPWEPVLLTVAR